MNLLSRLIEAIMDAPGKAKKTPNGAKCPTCDSPVVTVDGDGNLEVYHSDHVQKISLYTVLQCARTEKAKAMIRRYAAKTIVLLALGMPVLGQNAVSEPSEHDHITSDKVRFDLMRITPPSKVTYYDGVKMEFVYSDRKGVYINILDIPEKDVVVSDTFRKNWKTGMWWIIYCSADRHLYAISRVDPKQLR